MTIALVVICFLVASNILWLFAAARILDKLKVAKRDLEMVGACNERLTRELLASKCHIEGIQAGVTNSFLALRN